MNVNLIRMKELLGIFFDEPDGGRRFTAPDSLLPIVVRY
jgi:hypothetical protein